MKNKSFLKIGVFGFLATSSLLLFNNPSVVEANDDVTTPTHIGTYDGSTTFTTSSSNGVNPALFIEVIDKNGNLVQYESEDGVITVENTRAGAYVTQAKLFGKTMYRDLDTGELLESWEEGRNLELESSKMPVLKTFNDIVDFSNEKLEFEYGVYFGQKGDGTDQVNNKGVPSSFVYTLNYINILDNKDKMRFYGNDTIIDRIVWFDENKNQIDVLVGANNLTRNIPTGAKYFRFLLNDSRFAEDKELAKDNIGHYNIYYGDESQIFNNEPHKSNILTVNEDIELRGIGDVKDELDLMTGEVTQRLGYTEYLLQDLFGFSSGFGRGIQYNESSDRWYGHHNGINHSYFKNMLPLNFSITNDVNSNVSIYKVNTDWFAFSVKSSELISKGYEATADGLLNYAKNEKMICNYNLLNEVIKTVDLKASDYFSPETTAQISIEGETVPLIASITVPTETLSFVIDPNQEAGKQFIAPEFSVTNDTYAPLRLEIKSFSQVTNKMNDVLPSKYSDWDVLNKTESNDIALGIIPQGGDGWKSLTEGARYVADNSNYELGVIKPTETVDFKFSALHGPTILKPLNLKYELSFIFDFE